MRMMKLVLAWGAVALACLYVAFMASYVAEIMLFRAWFGGYSR